MSFVGVLRLFRTPGPGAVAADGRMALADHLRELRARILRSVAAILLTLVAALFFYEPLLDLVRQPYAEAQQALGSEVRTDPVFIGAGAPLLFQLKLCGLAALVLSSPYWLYQVWAFILPGLHAGERRWTRLFVAIAGPLFIAGVATGYYVLPKGLEVLIGFTPEGVQNLIEFGNYFTFFTRMLLVFGVAFEIPLFVVMLNLAGVVSGRALGEHRPWIVLGSFLFAAVATPSTDPFSMLMLAIPMTLLFGVSEVVARLVDRRRDRTSYTDLDDDEASPLDYRAEEVRRSDLDEDDLDEDD